MKSSVLALLTTVAVLACAEEGQYEDAKSQVSKRTIKQSATATASADEVEKSTTRGGGANDEREGKVEVSVRVTPETKPESETVKIMILADAKTSPVGGNGFQLQVVGLDDSYEITPIATDDVTWSLDEKFAGKASISPLGRLIAKKTGKFEVTATYGKLEAKETVEATAAEIVSVHFGCGRDELPPLLACSDSQVSACDMVPEAFDFAKGVTLRPGRTQEETRLLNTFPIFVTGYRSDCSFVDLSGHDGVTIISDFAGMTVRPDLFSIYRLDNAVTINYVGKPEEMRLRAFFVEEDKRVLSGSTEVKYRIEQDPSQ